MPFFATNALISLMAVVVSGTPTGVVYTTLGPVQGQILKTAVTSMKYARFDGIRYAKPPLGYLRFKPPVPVDPWTETFNATVEGNACAQMRFDTNTFYGSEDCLVLRVATPVTNLPNIPDKLKAVVVWFHGGAFQHGSSLFSKYSPDHLIERDVVYVTFGYRLGAFGFLNLNHPNATGNAGLKDQTLALKWIQANIENFGGNPNNVTLLGQSAGAAAVGFHIISDASAGLFHGAISMSGSALVSWGFDKPTESLTAAKKLGIALGTNSSDKEILLYTFYAASVEELVGAAVGTPTFLPTLENTNLGTDVFLSDCTINKYKSGNFSKVPQILGFVQYESILHLSRETTFISTIIEALKSYSSPILSELIDSAGSIEMLAKERNNFEIIVNETTDILFASFIDITQDILVAHNDDKPVYYYHFTFDSNVSIHSDLIGSKYYGATHNDDLAYMFWYPYVTDNLGPTGPLACTIHQVATMWTNFAKYGDPTPNWINVDSRNVTWPPSGRAGLTLEIGSELKLKSRPINMNTEIIKTAIMENIGSKSGCALTAIGSSCHSNHFNDEYFK